MTPEQRKQARELCESITPAVNDLELLARRLLRKALAALEDVERRVADLQAHSVYCLLVGRGMPEGMAAANQEAWLTQYLGERDSTLADVRGQLRDVEASREAIEAERDAAEARATAAERERDARIDEAQRELLMRSLARATGADRESIACRPLGEAIRHWEEFVRQKARADAAEQRLVNLVGAIQRYQPGGSPPPGNELSLAEWILSTLRARATAAERRVDESDSDADGMWDVVCRFLDSLQIKPTSWHETTPEQIERAIASMAAMARDHEAMEALRNYRELHLRPENHYERGVRAEMWNCQRLGHVCKSKYATDPADAILAAKKGGAE